MKVLVLAGSLVVSTARADDRTSVRLRPWITPESELDQPVLDDGMEASIDVGAGGAFSGFAKSPVVVETGAVGRYVASSGTQAWSAEAVETLDVAVDRTTPQFGMLALGLRRIGRQRLGDIRAVNFERVSAGLALLSHGSNLVTGVGAEIAGGTFGFCGSGLALHVDGYFFARPDAPGIDTIFTISLGYVYATPARRSIEREPSPMVAPPPAPESSRPACANVEAYRAALAAGRQRSAAACTAARDDATRVDECNRESDAVLDLRAKLAACLAGEDAR